MKDFVRGEERIGFAVCGALIFFFEVYKPLFYQ